MPSRTPCSSPAGAAPRTRNGRSREIEDVPIVEEPPRLIRQAHVLARGLYALGLVDDEVDKMMRRIALDSMPAARLTVLKALAKGDVQTTSGVARSSGLHWHVAHRHLEDMVAVGVPTTSATSTRGTVAGRSAARKAT